ncbi:MAG: hypothetical protein H7238_12490 [Polaromonas sp.]|nr:hypothetical protein [Polaromonas sp.]
MAQQVLKAYYICFKDYLAPSHTYAQVLPPASDFDAAACRGVRLLLDGRGKSFTRPGLHLLQTIAQETLASAKPDHDPF